MTKNDAMHQDIQSSFGNGTMNYKYYKLFFAVKYIVRYSCEIPLNIEGFVVIYSCKEKSNLSKLSTKVGCRIYS